MKTLHSIQCHVIKTRKVAKYVNETAVIVIDVTILAISTTVIQIVEFIAVGETHFTTSDILIAITVVVLFFMQLDLSLNP